MATAITFYSYKGGVGRTLALANVASQLAQLGRRVIVVDLDLEAPGVPYKLRPTEPVAGGVVDLVHDFLTTRRLGDIAPHLREVERPGSGDGLPDGWIKILPAGQVDDPSYWKRFAAINWREFFFGDGLSSSNTSAGLGLPFFAELKQQLVDSTQVDVILFDALTGITELGGVATALLADVLVCMFVLNDESIDGARRVIRAVHSARQVSELPAVRVFPVLARLPTPEDHPSRRRLNETQLRRLEDDIVASATRHLKVEGLEHVEPMLVLHSDPSLQLVERLHFASGPSTGGSLSDAVQASLSSLDGDGELRHQPHRLYFDYVRLFNQLIPAAVIDEYLDAMVKERRAALFDDPERAVELLRDLVRRFPLPRSYRALLQVYRLQKRYDEDALSLARDLVKATNDVEDDLVQDIVVHAIPYFEESVNVDDSDFDVTLLDFAADVWRSHAPIDPVVGLSLANLYAEAEREDTAAMVLEHVAHELVVQGGDHDTKVEVIVRLLAIGAGALALELLNDKTLDDHPMLLRLRMQAVLATRDPRLAQELIAGPDFRERAQRMSARSWVEVMRLAGKLEDAQAQAETLLGQLVDTLRRGEELSPRVVQRLGLLRAIYDALGKLDELRARLLDASAKHPSQQRRVARALDEPTNREAPLTDEFQFRWPRPTTWTKKPP